MNTVQRHEPCSQSKLPIGMFDSGVGGLTVLDALSHRLPDEDILYLGDTARLPYGTKSPETITRYALQIADKLVNRGIKILIVACNTVSAVALDALTSTWPDLPVIGVVHPGAQAGCAASKSGHIAVIATQSTIKGGAYQRAISALRPDSRVVALPCPLFVPLAEEGWMDGPIVEAVAARYLSPIFLDVPVAERPDCLVLACTHFPLLKSAIRNVIGPEPAIVDAASITAEAAAIKLAHDGLLHPENTSRQRTIRYLTTDDVSRFAHTGSLFLGRPIKNNEVELVDL